MDAAEASFKTWMDPTSSGFTQFRYESNVGVPSMMNSGSLFWNDVMPRIRTVLREPGEPPASTVTPATRPSSFCSTLDGRDRKSTRLNSSHSQISYAVFCLKKKKKKK